MGNVTSDSIFRVDYVDHNSIGIEKHSLRVNVHQTSDIFSTETDRKVHLDSVGLAITRHKRFQECESFSLVSDPLEVIQRTESGRLCLAANMREQKLLRRRLDKYEQEVNDAAWRMTHAQRPVQRRLDKISERRQSIQADRMKLLAAHEAKMKQISESLESQLLLGTKLMASRAQLVRFDVENLKDLIVSQRQRVRSTRSSQSLSLQVSVPCRHVERRLTKSATHPTAVEKTTQLDKKPRSAFVKYHELKSRETVM